MSHSNDDADLKASFAALRCDVLAGTPEFRVGVTPERPWFKRRSSLAAATAVLGGIAVVIWLVAAHEAGTELLSVVDPASPVWLAPTDFLLDTPGRDLLQGIPAVTGEGIPVNRNTDMRSWR